MQPPLLAQLPLWPQYACLKKISAGLEKKCSSNNSKSSDVTPAGLLLATRPGIQLSFSPFFVSCHSQIFFFSCFICLSSLSLKCCFVSVSYSMNLLLFFCLLLSLVCTQLHELPTQEALIVSYFRWYLTLVISCFLWNQLMGRQIKQLLTIARAPFNQLPLPSSISLFT